MKTEVIKIERGSPGKAVLKKAARVIEKGGIVAFPTETVYGLAADYQNQKAMDRLYEVKKRPKDKPFTVHIAKFSDLEKLACEVTLFSRNIIKRFWPGPLTLVFKAKAGGKIGVRMPSNEIAVEFISACGTSVVAPSANISGGRPPRIAEDVLKDLGGKIDLLLDGGPTEIGKESTVIDVSELPFRLLRRGAIDSSRIADLGRELRLE